MHNYALFCSISLQKPYNPCTSNCEHAVMKATIDDEISIQINVITHRALQVGKGATVAGLSQIIIPRGPLLAHGIHQVYRKKIFSQISEREYRRTVIELCLTHGNAVLGGILGAIVGQVVIPVPIVGAMIGGVGGKIVGNIAGATEGKAIGKCFYPEKITTLPVVEKHTFIRRDSSFPKKDEAESEL